MLAGKPMVQHVYERTLNTPSVSRVLVATDDKRIITTVLAFGGEAVMTGEHANGTERIAAVMSDFALEDKQPGYVLNVQGDEPLIDPDDLESLIQGMFQRPQAVMGTLMHPLENEQEAADPNVVKVVCDWEGKALYFSRSQIPHPRHEGPLGMRHLGIYLYQTGFLQTYKALKPTPLSERESLEQLRALEHGYSIHCFEAKTVGFGVDVPEDLKKAEAYLKSLS